MAFNLFGKRKKYPFNKLRKDPAAAVYAGPEYFERRNGGGRLYAGPEPSKNRAGENRDEMKDVYAGPEYFGIKPDWDPDAVEAEIYAGPEAFEGRLSPEKDAPEEDAPLPPEESVPVYAGPEDAEELVRKIKESLDGAKEPDSSRRARFKDMEEQTRLVYAGPEYFARRRRQAEEQAQGEGGKADGEHE